MNSIRREYGFWPWLCGTIIHTRDVIKLAIVVRRWGPLLLGLLFLAGGCTTTRSFRNSWAECEHTVDATMFGTVQLIQCVDQSNKLVVNDILPGTAIVEPVEKLLEAGAIAGGAYGILKNSKAVTTDSTIHIKP